MGYPIFFSDLDQTMIYSTRQIAKHNDDVNKQILVESYNGKPISYMTKDALAKLGEISQVYLFVPTTTRTLDQYNRIDFGKHVFASHAITTNGGRIVDNGKEDKQWTKNTVDLISSQGVEPVKALEELNSLIESSSDVVKNHIIKVRSADNFFNYLVTDLSVERPDNFVEELKAKAEEWNYVMSFQSTKIYFIPKVLTKERAALEIMERADCIESVAAGDSFLDIGLMAAADYGIRPRHGEIESLPGVDKFAVTERKGIYAAEEILDFVERKFERR